MVWGLGLGPKPQTLGPGQGPGDTYARGGAHKDEQCDHRHRQPPWAGPRHTRRTCSTVYIAASTARVARPGATSGVGPASCGSRGSI